MNAKQAAAFRACELVDDGMVVGLGTGSTAEYAVKRLGDRIRDEGLQIKGVPTSEATQQLARHVNIPLVTLDEVTELDVTIDGADEVDPDLELIKGLGGALLREKVVASVTRREIIIADASKLVDALGEKAPLPVEVLRFGAAPVKRHFERRGWKPELRTKDGEPFLTDNGNYILDVRFPEGLVDPAELERVINTTPGVVENGLFLGIAQKVVIGKDDGTTEERDRRA